MTKRSIVGFVLACGFVLLCGGSRPPSTVLHFPRSFVLTVADEQRTVARDPRTDSPVRHSSESVTIYYGRLEDAGDKQRAAVATFNDSLRFRGISPFQYETFMSRDTLLTISRQNESVVQGGSPAIDKPMLRCLFDGPSLQIGFPEDGEATTVEHLKTDCPSGIYRRLDLPRALGVFVLRVPAGQRKKGDYWEAVRSCPSYSGLGYFPDLRFTYRILHTDEKEMTVQISCDTTLTNVHVITPNGDKATVIQDRIHVEGSLTIAGHAGISPRGEALIRENIRYVRSESGSDVLQSECEYRLTLTSH